MIRILGRKILMQRGEVGAFRVMIIDSKGNEVQLSKNDRIIMRAVYAMEADSKFRKVATPIEFDIEGKSELYHIIQFKSTDTRELLTGDYHYELVFERNGIQSVVIPTSIFTLENSIDSVFPKDDLILLGEGIHDEEEDEDEEDTLIIIDDSDEEVTIFEEEDDSLEPQYSIIISTPLIGNLNAVAQKQLLTRGDESEDDLIIIV